MNTNVNKGGGYINKGIYWCNFLFFLFNPYLVLGGLPIYKIHFVHFIKIYSPCFAIDLEFMIFVFQMSDFYMGLSST